ncbi:MAG: HIRAN domain-containing protein [archaeon]
MGFYKKQKGEFGNMFNTNLDFDPIPEKINLAGVTFENRQTIISKLKKGSKVKLVRDYCNKYDKNAIKVITNYNNKNIQIGWIPKQFAEILAPEIDANINWNGKISEILGGTKDKETYGILIEIYYIIN